MFFWKKKNVCFDEIAALCVIACTIICLPLKCICHWNVSVFCCIILENSSLIKASAHSTKHCGQILLVRIVWTVFALRTQAPKNGWIHFRLVKFCFDSNAMCAWILEEFLHLNARKHVNVTCDQICCSRHFVRCWCDWCGMLVCVHFNSLLL